MEFSSVVQLLGDIQHNLSMECGYTSSKRREYKFFKLGEALPGFNVRQYKFEKIRGVTHIKLRLWFEDLKEAVRRLELEYGRRIVIKIINKNVMELAAPQELMSWDKYERRSEIISFLGKMGAKEITDFEWIGTDYDEEELVTRGMERNIG